MSIKPGKFQTDAAKLRIPIDTDEFEFVRATQALTLLESSDIHGFGETLAAAIPEKWPPPSVSHPSESGDWQTIYVIVKGNAPDRRLLAGMAAFGSLASEPDTLLLGIAVAEEHQGSGIGPRAFDKLTREAALNPQTPRILCDIPVGHPTLESALERVGYKRVDSIPYQGFVRFEFLAQPV